MLDFICRQELPELSRCELRSIVMTCSGRPQCANISLNTVLVLATVIIFISTTPGHLAWKLNATNSIFLIKGSAKSRWIHCHGTVGWPHPWVHGALAGANVTAWHVGQTFAHSATSPNNSGHHT